MSVSDTSRPLLDPQAFEIMANAFQHAWATLCASGERLSAQETCDARIVMSQVILEGVLAGERNTEQLRQMALSALDASHSEERPAPTGLYL